MTEPSEYPIAPFEGVGVALCTIFDSRRQIDAAATAALSTQLVDCGVDAVVVAGTTGEAATLTRKERRKLLTAVREAVGGQVPVIAGTGAPSIHQATILTADAVDHGADAVLALSLPGVDDPRAYYDAIAKDTAGVPLLAYHYPKASNPGIPVDLLADLPVAGCKDSSGDGTYFLEAVTEWEGPMYTGAPALLSWAGPIGASGAILGLANLEPELCRKAFYGDAEAQRDLAGPIQMTRGVAALKDLVASRFGVSSVTRVP